MIEAQVRTAAAMAAFLSFGCTAAARNPVLDNYPAGVSGRTAVVYYDVKGRTVAELTAEMRRLGPRSAGSRFFGETRSPMRWTWRVESIGASTCSISDVRVEVTAEITMPRWSPPPDAAPELVAEWSRFIKALETHEAGHKDISAKAGAEIRSALRGLSGICSQISFQANDVARRIVERAAQEQQAYDTATRHGATQGTSFGAGIR